MLSLKENTIVNSKPPKGTVDLYRKEYDELSFYKNQLK